MHAKASSEDTIKVFPGDLDFTEEVAFITGSPEAVGKWPLAISTLVPESAAAAIVTAFLGATISGTEYFPFPISKMFDSST